ncbi:uncharacterized protein LOC100907614 [Galendromus occidentalis]|uniref:Uncharacterized protein LOC100907614 n=1 Tax=Galendromus occidentalis TaxID=34638 RepID=A0AAJ7WI63_9ACAR|nr:uncharacterized protein LOC100907614 [Galendromus occidentalis]
MECGFMYPVPDEKDMMSLLRGDLELVKNFAMSAILHCVNARRFCYYIGNSAQAFENLIPFDDCSLRPELNDFLVSKNSESSEDLVGIIREIPEKLSPALIIVEVPENRTPYGLVNLFGYAQDLQLKLKCAVLILVEDTESCAVISERLLKFYKLKVFDVFRWGLRSGSEETIRSFVECDGRLLERRIHK